MHRCSPFVIAEDLTVIFVFITIGFLLGRALSLCCAHHYCCPPMLVPPSFVHRTRHRKPLVPRHLVDVVAITLIAEAIPSAQVLIDDHGPINITIGASPLSLFIAGAIRWPSLSSLKTSTQVLPFYSLPCYRTHHNRMYCRSPLVGAASSIAGTTDIAIFFPC